MTPGSGNFNRPTEKNNSRLISILEQNNRQLQIMNDRIQFLETGGRANSSYTGHFVGDTNGRNNNNTTISTPLIDKFFQTNSDVNAIQHNGSSQFGPMAMVPQHLFYNTPQAQSFYAQPTPSPINMMPNNWLSVNTPQGIMYQQQANQQGGYNNEPNSMFDYALLDVLAYNKRKR